MWSKSKPGIGVNYPFVPVTFFTSSFLRGTCGTNIYLRLQKCSRPVSDAESARERKGPKNRADPTALFFGERRISRVRVGNPRSPGNLASFPFFPVFPRVHHTGRCVDEIRAERGSLAITRGIHSLRTGDPIPSHPNATGKESENPRAPSSGLPLYRRASSPSSPHSSRKTPRVEG